VFTVGVLLNFGIYECSNHQMQHAVFKTTYYIL